MNILPDQGIKAMLSKETFLENVIAGDVTPEIWNRLGTKILPRLRSALPACRQGSDFKIGIEFSVTIDGRLARTFEATRGQVFKVFTAIANLADKSNGAKVKIRVEGTSAAGVDQSWLRNAVDEPLDKADIERIPEGYDNLLGVII